MSEYDRTPAIREAESLALEMTRLTEAERAAWRAQALADPYSWPTYRDAHARAVRDLDAVRTRFLRALVTLEGMGLYRFAADLHHATISLCVVARRTADDRLAAELRQAAGRAAP